MVEYIFAKTPLDSYLIFVILAEVMPRLGSVCVCGKKLRFVVINWLVAANMHASSVTEYTNLFI